MYHVLVAFGYSNNMLSDVAGYNVAIGTWFSRRWYLLVCPTLYVIKNASLSCKIRYLVIEWIEPGKIGQKVTQNYGKKMALATEMN